MTIEEIKNLLIAACRQYYKWMEEKGKGRSEIGVYEINPLKDKGSYSLKLNAQLFSLDAIVFEFPRSGKIYDTAQIKILEYDYDKRVLLIKPTPECEVNFNQLEARDIKVISDLKFLIERLGKYYEKKGSRIKLPVRKPDIGFDSTNFDYLPIANPSEQQKIALNTIFHNPLSYIWGAPGTGKTRFVLANSLLKYIREGKRIGIFAPTNVALEQVMIGILEFTDSAGIAREKILRIGNPSRKFAQKYPEVCEVAGIERQIQQLRKQIQILKGLLGISDVAIDKATFNELLSLRNEKNKIIKEVASVSDSIKECANTIKQFNERISHNENILALKRSQILKFERNKSSLLGSIVTAFSHGYYDSKINTTERVIRTVEAELLGDRNKQSQLNYRVEEQNTTVQQYNKKLKKLKENILAISFLSPEMQEAWTLNNIGGEKSIENLREILETLDKNVENSAMLENEYSKYSSTDLQQKLNKYVDELAMLEAQSIDERIKDVYVVGATLDGFVGKYLDRDVVFEHVFIDEAAYSNAAKAFVLFTLNSPITFLGDHMQLPPVTEMKVEELDEKNKVCLPILQSSLHSESFFHESFENLFSILKNNTEPTFTTTVKAELTETHRFGNNLANVLDKFVYQNGFKSVSTIDNTEIIIIHADRKQGKKKWENVGEVVAIEHYVALYHKTDNDFAILAPYNNQVYLIGHTLNEIRNDQRIMTIHKSQGQEWGTVIFSVSDSHSPFMVDSRNARVNAVNLINTAVSRAKRRLVIVCDTNYWSNQPDQFICGLVRAGKLLN
ncbi:MAG: hypothetical protein F9K23_08585 [Bacteroidetes bacterium]|nr:MAG: hypothetical protein F9K23_08585 [Bacteroidota bacterium]